MITITEFLILKQHFDHLITDPQKREIDDFERICKNQTSTPKLVEDWILDLQSERIVWETNRKLNKIGIPQEHMILYIHALIKDSKRFDELIFDIMDEYKLKRKMKNFR